MTWSPCVALLDIEFYQTLDKIFKVLNPLLGAQVGFEGCLVPLVEPGACRRQVVDVEDCSKSNIN